MLLRKLGKTLRKSLTAMLAAAVVVTSAPQLSIGAMAQEIVSAEVTSENELETEETETQETETQEADEETDVEASESVEDEGSTEEEATEEDTDVEETTDSEDVADETTEELEETKSESVQIEVEAETTEATVNKALRFDLDAATEWTDYIQQEVKGFEDVTDITADYSISYDLYISSGTSFEGTYYIKPVVKLGESQTWTQNDAEDQIAQPGSDNFTACDESENLLKYTYTGKIGTAVDSYIYAVVVNVGSSSASYDGAMFVDNVKLLNAEGDVVKAQDFNSDESAVELGNLDGITSGDDEEEEEDPVQTVNKALRFEVSAIDGDYANVIDKAVEGFSDTSVYGENGLQADYAISYDLYIPMDTTFAGDYYIKPVVKLGAGWTWTDGDSTDGKNVSSSDFVACEESESLVKYTYTGKLGTAVAEADSYIAAIEVVIGSSSVDYEGVIFVDNVKLLDAEGNTLAVNDFASDASAVELGNMDGLTSGDDQDDEEEDANVVYRGTNSVPKAVDFSELEAEDWGKKAEVSYAYTNDSVRNVNAKYTVDAKITISAEDYATLSASENNYIKFQGIVKLGEGWTYTKSDACAELKAVDFTADGDNYVADIQVEFTDKAGVLMEIDFEIVGVGFKGTVNISDVVVKNVPVSYESVLYENESNVTIAVDFSELEAEDWGKKGEVVYAYTNDAVRTVENKYKINAKILIDAAAYETLAASENNYIKFQGIVKLGEGWTYTKSDACAELKAADFTADGDNYVAEIQLEFTDKAGVLMEIDFEIVGVGFKGTINISDVKVTNITTEQPELEERDDAVLSDLSTEEDYNRWGTETGWDYFHGGTENATPVIGYDSENQRLQVTLDYSANATSTWSEAKVNYTPAEPADVSQYNQISVDIIYPDTLDGTKMKFFSTGVMEKDTVIDESTAEDLGNGMKKVTVSVGFSPSQTPLESITIGIIGVSTSFAGDVYLDNLVLSQKKASEQFVEITAVPGEGSPADISKAPSSVKLTDANANDSAKALYAYLSALANSDQVLFGHQNDVSRSVSSAADLGDVYDVTGQVSGIFGIDSLALAGSEAGGSDAASALANSVAYSKTAAENGAIVTLSTHMPNFTNSKIVKNEDGTYNFFACDFNESKDLSNTVAKKILPGGEYNEVYNAYLDIIVDYAKQLQEDNIPIIFRPLHENTGNWFWWGSSNTSETYKSLFRYTKDYIESKDVHNMLWVYSPNGPITSEAQYLSYYPGDEYVDILAFDYYDDYNTYPATYSDSFFTNIDKTCEVIASVAEQRGKLAAISESGVRVMKADGSGNDGLLVKGNPVRQEVSEKNWYTEINNIAKKYDMPYYLVWANFSDTNFYVPYKYDETYGHEMINEFIDFYNDETTIFGGDANFYENIETLASATKETYTNQMGYMVSPFDLDTVKEPTQIKALVQNATKVQFVVENPQAGTSVTLDAAVVEEGDVAASKLWSADLTQEAMDTVGKTEVATITLLVDDVQIAKLSNIVLGKDKEMAPANVFDNFDYYSGSDGLLDVAYSSNSAANCNSSFVLDTENKIDGTYGGAFKYKLETTGSEVWTGRIKASLTSEDFSAYNAMEMWVKPDGNGQKLVVQLTDASGEEFEVYLTDFVKGTEAQYVTIPFSSFKGKQGGTLDNAHITKFAVWCNSIIPEGHEGTWLVDSTIYFDGIQAVSLTSEQLAQNPVDTNGLIISDASLLNGGGSVANEGIWMEEIPEQTYTGKAIKPAVKVYDGTKLLTEKKDYTVSYKNNTSAGTATVTVKGKGNYNETITEQFVINRKSMNEVTVTAPEYLVYNAKKEQNISVSVKDGKNSLNTKDYIKTITYKGEDGQDEGVVVTKAKEKGIYEIEIAGTRNYTDSKTVILKVVEAKLLNKASLKLPSSSLDYKQGAEVKFEDESKIIVKLSGTEVPKDAYTIRYENNTEVSKEAVIIVDAVDGSGYVGSLSKKFTIKGTDFKESNVKIEGFVKSIPYTGEEITQTLTLTDKKTGEELTVTDDYEIAYSNNLNAGKATVTLTGLGKYSGTIKKTYTISKVKLTADMVLDKNMSAEQNRAGAMVDPRVMYNEMELVKDVDYTLSYSNNKNATTDTKKAYVNIKGKGNYTGTLKKAVEFEITAKAWDSSDIEIVVADVKYNKNTKEYKPSVTVYDNGKKLANKKDYTFVYADNKKADVELGEKGYDVAKVIVSAAGKDYVAGDREVEFRITAKMIKDAKVEVINTQYFNQQGVRPTKDDLQVTFKVGKVYEPIDTDCYEIISYGTNNKKGKGTLVLQGLGEYGGTKSVTFTIKERGILTNLSEVADAISTFFSNIF